MPITTLSFYPLYPGYLMSERLFRLISGALLYLALTLSALLESPTPTYIYLSLVLFEAITNWRIPIIITRLRYGKQYKSYLENFSIKDKPASTANMFNNIEAERFLRVLVFILVLIPLIIHIDNASYQIYIDYIPWFVATMLCLAGVTNICPMVMFLRTIGMHK